MRLGYRQQVWMHRDFSAEAQAVPDHVSNCKCLFVLSSSWPSRAFTLSRLQLAYTCNRCALGMPGYYNPLPGGSTRDACAPCPPGFFSALGSGSCNVNCPPGSGGAGSPAPGQCIGCSVCSGSNPQCDPSRCPACGSCAQCSPGQFSTGPSGCRPCPAGTSIMAPHRRGVPVPA
jgi:hypothetical protein